MVHETPWSERLFGGVEKALHWGLFLNPSLSFVSWGIHSAPLSFTFLMCEVRAMTLFTCLHLRILWSSIEVIVVQCPAEGSLSYSNAESPLCSHIHHAYRIPYLK